MSGFEVLRSVREANQQAQADEDRRLDERTDLTDPSTRDREHVPVEMWRACRNTTP